MFFFASVFPKQKELDHLQSGICPSCGAFGSYRVFVRYMCFALFFIPLFRWGKHYFVEMSCCHALYELDPEIGKAIAHGDGVEILPQHLHPVSQGNSQYCLSPLRPALGRTVSYCPYCGTKL